MFNSIPSEHSPPCPLRQYWSPRVNPLRRPRLWARLAATMMIIAAGWLLLVPITAVYVTSDGTSDSDQGPRAISTLYSWSTSDEVLVYSDDGLSKAPHVVKGIRLGCGNGFNSGAHEQLLQGSDGPRVCSEIKAPRCILGLSLVGLGALGVLGAVKLPVEPERYRNRYRQPYSQRRVLKRGR
jgi:hypothetical protein